jgi:hypothetical protein
VLAIVYVVRDDLYAEVRHGVEPFLGKEHSAYLFRTLQVAELEGDELLEAVQVAVDCCVVPPGRYDEL